MFYFVEFSDPISSFCEAESLTIGIAAAGTARVGGGATAPRAQLHDISFSKKMNGMTPLLAEACATGRRFETVTVEYYKDLNGQAVLTYTLTDAMVAAISSTVYLGSSRFRSALKPCASSIG